MTEIRCEYLRCTYNSNGKCSKEKIKVSPSLTYKDLPKCQSVTIEVENE